jgi:PKD domain-containing protein
MSHKFFRWFVSLMLALAMIAMTSAPHPARAAGPWYVATTGDDNNDCLSPGNACATINGTIAKASAGEIINVAEGTYTGVGTEVVLIDKDITLSGGWDPTFTTQSGMSTIDGEGIRRGIIVNSGMVASIEHFVVQNGFFGADFDGGGGIRNNGNLTVNNSTVRHNTIAGYSSAGGGIYNYFGTMTLNNSAVSGNDGGGIYNSFGTMTLNNSTVSSNIAGVGAGIFNGGTLAVNSSTISHNTAISTGGIFQYSGSATLQNSILAGNTGGSWPDCAFPPTSAGYNIIGDATSCNFSPTTGDQINVDPKIGLFMGNPGYHPLLANSPAIDAGNPAGCMDSSSILTSDQRGVPRVGICDIGAYEYTAPGVVSSLFVISGSGQSAAPTNTFPKPLQIAALDSLGSPVSGVTVDFVAPGSGPSGTFSSTGTNTTSVLTDGGGVATTSTFTANNQFGAYTVSASASGAGSVNFNLQNAVWYVAGTGNDSNTCSSSGDPCGTINGAIGKAAEADTIFVAAGTYTGSGTDVVLVNKSINLFGGWDDGFTSQNGTSIIDGQGERRGIQVNNFTSMIIERFTIQNGSAVGDGAGGIWNSGTLTINYSTVRGNTATTDGGGILNVGVLTVNNSSIINNTGGSGGGISNGSTGFGLLATAQIINSTISGNSADSRGGGIGNPSTGTLTLYNSTIYGNHDTFSPGSGGIYNGGGSVTLQNSILAGNSNPNSGGMDCSGTVLSTGYNLIGNTSGCSFSSSSGDQTNIDPNVGQLIGPSEKPYYHPLLSGSPAIDAGNPAGCTDQNTNLLSTDQRGAARVGTCDIGAYEFTTPGLAASLSVVAGDHQSTTSTLAFPQPLQVAALDSQGSPVSGVTIDFTAPTSGPSGTFSDSGTNTTSATTGGDGVATSSVLTANALEGAYSVIASSTGLGSVNFNLEQIIRPINDDFANAKVITALPFHESIDNTQTTVEPGESHFCGSTPQIKSVWYSFTPANNVTVTADMSGSSFSDTALTLYRAIAPGLNGLNFLDRACFGGTVTFTMQAGTTYYFQAESISSGGDLHFNIEQVLPPANDDFAGATLITFLPFDETVDTSSSTVEAQEPTPACYGGNLLGSVWYAFTPSTSGSVSVTAFNLNGNPVLVEAYTGSSLATLTDLGCRILLYNVATFHVDAGVIYYVQVAIPDFYQGGPTQVHIDVAPPPVAGFSYSPFPPSSFDTIQFFDTSYDPAQAGFETYTWSFGDGASSAEANPNHKYAADGDYLVEHSATTFDGRTASTSQVVQVRTHDVGITKVSAPQSARSGQTKAITVAIRNTHYPETVTVDLYKSTPGGDVWIGAVTLQVPVLSGNKTKLFAFNYTFTLQDAQIGKVTFRAVATINGANDAFPQDNTGISSPPTKVAR